MNVVELRPAAQRVPLKELLERERFTRKQAGVVREGLRWAARFKVLDQQGPWQRYAFDPADLRSALVLSLIFEHARRA